MDPVSLSAPFCIGTIGRIQCRDGVLENPIIATTQIRRLNLYSNYVVVLLFSVNLVKEETGKKA